MGREFKPGPWSILLDFDNKADEASHSGLDLAKKLNMDQYNAPNQKTPSKGLHCIYNADAQHKDHITARTTTTYQGAVYNKDFKFKNGLCKCAPSNVEGYGKYAWTKRAADERLENIPKLPDELFETIKVAPQPTTTTATKTNPRSAPAPSAPTTTTGPSSATAKELQDIKALCCCLPISKLDNYATWLLVSMILKKLGAPMSFWEDVSRRNKKYKNGDCSRR